MKYNSLTAEFSFGRAASSGRKMFSVALMAVVFLAVAWLYWMHLVRLTHVAPPIIVASQTVAAAPAAAKATPVAAPSVQAVPILKKTAADSVAALWTYLLEAAKVMPAPAAPAVPKTIPATVAAAPLAVSAAKANAVSTPPVIKHPQMPTEASRLLLAAQTAFANVMDSAYKYPDAYGFKPDDVLEDAKLGSAMPVFMITEQDRDSYQSGQPIKPLLKPADQWVFPILLGNEVRCMVQVSRVGHNYVPGSGSKLLAMTWAKIQEKWPASQGFHPQLIISSSVDGYYFTVPEVPAQNITDVSRMLDYEPSLSPAEVILASWR